MDVAVRFAEKYATVRFLPAKARLEQILQRYDATPFTVSSKGPVTRVAVHKNVTVRAWSKRTKTPTQDPSARRAAQRLEVFAELTPAVGNRFTSPPTVAVSKPAAQGLKLLEKMQPVERSGPKGGKLGAQAFVARLEQSAESQADRLFVPITFQGATEGELGKLIAKGTIDAIVRDASETTIAQAAKPGVALIGGALEMKLGHLCDQKGCVSHFHQSLRDLPGLAGVRPYPSLREPRATAFLLAGQPVDVWMLRERLRERSVEIAQLVPRELESYRLRVDLVRWRAGEAGEVHQSLASRQRVQEMLRASWAKDVQVAGGGLTFRPVKTDRDLIELLDGITKTGIAPAAVWLIPDGAPMPKATLPRPLIVDNEARGRGTDGYASVELDFANARESMPSLRGTIAQQKWADHVHLAANGESVVAWLRPRARTYAPLTPLLNQLQQAGRVPEQIRLQGFGDVRVTIDFAHLCGDVEMSQPPKPKKPPKPGSKPENKPDSKPEKKFVARPLRPAKSSNARKAIEAALTKVDWVNEAVYRDYHTKPTFNGPTKLSFALRVKGEGVARVDEVVDALRRAGFPPKSVTVSRLFPSLSFGSPAPADLALTDANGKQRSFSALFRPKRPLVVAFVSLNSPRKKYSKHKPDPALYSQLKETIAKHKDRADFVAVSANPKDKYAEVARFLEKTGLQIPVLHDAGQKVRPVLNVQNAPPPHLFIFDGQGLLRYAGDPHDSWTNPDKRKENYLEQALELVLAGKYQANGAVYYNSPRCNCSSPKCKCPKCGCGPSCRCPGKH